MNIRASYNDPNVEKVYLKPELSPDNFAIHSDNDVPCSDKDNQQGNNSLAQRLQCYRRPLLLDPVVHGFCKFKNNISIFCLLSSATI